MAKQVAVMEDSQQAMKWLIWGGALTSIFFYSNLNDPFNAPKSWILGITAFWLLGWVLTNANTRIAAKPLRWATLLAGAYGLALTIAFIATDNKYVGLFGDYLRRTGLLSYLCLIIFFLAASYLFEATKLGLFARAVIIIGAFEGVYGIAQHFKLDFVQWNNPYNSVLTTLGNPDFAAAFMSIFLILNFGICIQPRNPKWLRIVSLINSTLLFVAIIFSKALQGLLTSILGIAIILLIWLYQRNKRTAFALSGISLVIGVFSLIGMLNQGPLAKYFYKDSVTNRGDYWRAGWRMFIHNPLFGVGLDRYGANFREFRDATQVARRGPSIVSNAAHSVPIQLAATGGILVLLTFLALTLFIAWRGIISIKNSTGATQLTNSVVFAAWIAYQGQSQISIDNLGIATWGYLLGGAVVGLSIPAADIQKQKRTNSYAQPLVSGLLTVAILIITSFFYQSEAAMKHFQSYQIPKTQSDLAAYRDLAKKPLTYGFKEASFAVAIAGKLAEANSFPEAIGYLQSVIKSDPRNFEATELLARIYEYQKNYSSAIELRKQIIVIDPFNNDNKKLLSSDEKALTAR